MAYHVAICIARLVSQDCVQAFGYSVKIMPWTAPLFWHRVVNAVWMRHLEVAFQLCGVKLLMIMTDALVLAAWH
mgnify:CR=1 FL=1